MAQSGQGCKRRRASIDAGEATIRRGRGTAKDPRQEGVVQGEIMTKN